MISADKWTLNYNRTENTIDNNTLSRRHEVQYIHCNSVQTILVQCSTVQDSVVCSVV